MQSMKHTKLYFGNVIKDGLHEMKYECEE